MNKKSLIAVLIGSFLLFALTTLLIPKKQDEFITIAILAKDKAASLPIYLKCIENQTWPAEKTYLYIRTNNNTDETAKILRNWIATVGNRYAGIYFDESDVEQQVQQFKPHEWNATRFQVLGKIRQDSVDWAKEHHSHYFVADCDNFIQPHTLETLYRTKLPIVAPFLRASDTHLYANFHTDVDHRGYYISSPLYGHVWNRSVVGFIQVPVVHCTYFIQHDVLDKIAYLDETDRHEYVIFSHNARKHHIPQYLDNREIYGRITFAEDATTLNAEAWISEFKTSSDIEETAFTRIN